MSAPWVTGQNQTLVVDLRNALRQSGAHPVKDAASATVIIDLATVDYTRFVTSVDSKGTATGYTLEYQVLYRVVDRLGRVLVENTSLSVSRDLEYKSTQLLQKKQEEEALKISMRQEIVRRIIRRLGGIAFNRQAPEGSRVVFV